LCLPTGRVLTSEGVASKEHVPHVRPREQTGGTALVSGNIQPHAVLTHQDGSCLKDLAIAIETWAVDVVVVSGPSQLPNLMPNAGIQRRRSLASAAMPG
jgi:hypothetical protein